jgi:hypothetical protein
MIGDERSFRGRRLGPRLKERRGSAAIRIHAGHSSGHLPHVELHRIQIL